MDYIIGGAGVDYEIVQPSPSTPSFIGNLPDERSVYFVMMLKGLIEKTDFATLNEEERTTCILAIAKSADTCVRALNDYRLH